MLVDIAVLFQSSVFQSACSYLMRNNYTRNSNVASEGDQTFCNYKGVFLKKVTGIIAVIFLPVFWPFSELNALNCKVTIFFEYLGD